MYIYFIRHGETEFNKRVMHQNGDVPLAPNGREQIAKAATIVKTLPVTKLISSDYERARESAIIIGEEIGLTHTESPLFREVKRPSSLYGHKHYSVATFNAGLHILSNIKNPTYHFQDEENLYDLKKRVADGVAYLEEVGKEHEHVAVVAHAFIISLFIKYMCAYKDVRARDFIGTLMSANKLGNASISTVVYSNDGNPNTCDWMCIKLNDKSHLM